MRANLLEGPQAVGSCTSTAGTWDMLTTGKAKKILLLCLKEGELHPKGRWESISEDIDVVESAPPAGLPTPFKVSSWSPGRAGEEVSHLLGMVSTKPKSLTP